MPLSTITPRCAAICSHSSSASSSDNNASSKILSLVFITILTNASYASIAPILPLELGRYYYNNNRDEPHQSHEDNNKNDENNEVYMSLIFLCFSFGSIVTPPLVSRHFGTSCGGTLRIMSIAMMGMAVLFYCLGSVFRIYTLWMIDDNDDTNEDEVNSSSVVGNSLLISLICTTQFCIGGFLSIVTTGYYSTATLIRTNNSDRIISYIESAVGTGYILGPVIGSYLYDELGYEYVYRLVSMVMIALGLVTMKFISPLFTEARKMNDDDCDFHSEEGTAGDVVDNEEYDYDSSTLLTGGDLESRLENGRQFKENNNERQPLLTMSMNVASTVTADAKPTIIHLLKHPRILFSALCITWSNVSWTFVEPILATRLDTYFHLGKKEIGVLFSLSNFVYIPSAFLLQFALVGSRKRRMMIFLSTAVTPLAVLLVGSTSIHWLITGILLLGLLPTPVFVMLLPSMQEDALAVYQDNVRYRRMANDLTAGMFNSFLSLGQVLGYCLGPTLNAMVGFSTTTWAVAGLIMMQAILYYYFVLISNDNNVMKTVRGKH